MINTFHLLTQVKEYSLRDIVTDVIGYGVFIFWLLVFLREIYRVKKDVIFCEQVSKSQWEQLEQKLGDDINVFIMNSNEKTRIFKKCFIFTVIGCVLIVFTTIIFVIIMVLRNYKVGRLSVCYAFIDFLFGGVVSIALDKTKKNIKL